MSRSERCLEDNFDFIDDDFWTDELEAHLQKVDTECVSSPELSLHASTNLSPAESGHKSQSAGTCNDDSVLQATGASINELSTYFDEDFGDTVHNEQEPKIKLEQSGVRGAWTGFGSNQCLVKDDAGMSRKRRFPGPAGVLPKTCTVSLSEMRKSSDESKKLTRKSTTSEVCTFYFEDLPCTPWPSENDSPQSPWGKMMQDLDKEQGRSILEFNIAWVLKMKKLKQLPRGKVPVLCVTIKALDKEMLTFRDRTGEISASVDKSIADLREHFKPRAALLLRRVSVYSNARGRHCLNVTRDNIVNIYGRGDDDDDDGFGGKVVVNPATAAELLTLSNRMRREASEDAAARNPTFGPPSPPFPSWAGTSPRHPVATAATETRWSGSPVIRRSKLAHSDDAKRGTGSPNPSSRYPRSRNVESAGRDDGGLEIGTRGAENGCVPVLVSPARTPAYKVPDERGSRCKGFVSDRTGLGHAGGDVISRSELGGRTCRGPAKATVMPSKLKVAQQRGLSVKTCASKEKSIFRGTAASTEGGAGGRGTPPSGPSVDEELRWLHDEADDIFRAVGEEYLS